MYYNKNDKPKGNVIIDLKRVADIGSEPIDTATAKLQPRITFSDDDTEIAALITKARKYIENYCNISIVIQRIKLVMKVEEEFNLPLGPVIGIELVEDYQGVTGSGPVSYATSEADWQIDGDLYDPGCGYRQRITYTTGMDECPADLKDVILELICFLYENRGKEPTIDEMMPILLKAQHYQKKWTL